MTRLAMYQVDAFTDSIFSGNPAAVVPLASWLPDDIMQAIANENNLSETAFFVPVEKGYELCWFTPTSEIELCGHATLAAAHVLFRHLGHKDSMIRFFTRHKGELPVTRREDMYAMNFPAYPAKKKPISQAIKDALQCEAVEAWETLDTMAVFSSEQEIAALSPEFPPMLEIPGNALIATAPGKDADFVSRVFVPKLGIPEDPVTGSAHCTLIPYWAKRLGKNKLRATQISKRGGELFCELQDRRVEIAGYAVTYMTGKIRV